MKLTKHLSIFLAAVTLAANASASSSDGVITIKVGRNAKTYLALVEKWSAQYMQEHPSKHIQVVTDKNASADLTLVSTFQDHQRVTPVARYALLPVTSTANPLLPDIQRKEWRGKDLKHLFFTADEAEEEEEGSARKNKLTDRLTVYSGSSLASASSAFASYFGRSADEIKGNRIAGDDSFLLTAIEEDTSAVTFNPISNVYDLQSRRLRTHLAPLPLSVKKVQSEALAGGTLDQLIQLLEKEHVDLVPIAPIGLASQHADKDIEDFLSWIVGDGQALNHQLGFLQLTPQESARQLELLTHEEKQ